MIVRVTMQPDVDIEVTEQEAAGLRDLGILIEPALVEPEPPAAVPPSSRPRRSRD